MLELTHVNIYTHKQMKKVESLLASNLLFKMCCSATFSPFSFSLSLC